MVNLESRIMPAIAQVLNFVKEQTSADLKTQHASGELGQNITEGDMERLCMILENSIGSNFMRASNQITSAINELQSKVDNSATKKKKK